MTSTTLSRKLAWLAAGSLLALAAFGSSVGTVAAHDNDPCATQAPSGALTQIDQCNPCPTADALSNHLDNDACNPCDTITPTHVDWWPWPWPSQAPKPTCAPSPSPTVAPSPTPTPTPEPSFTGGAGGVTDQPTLPPTDRSGGSGNISDSLGLVLMVMAAVLAGLMVLTPARRRR